MQDMLFGLPDCCIPQKSSSKLQQFVHDMFCSKNNTTNYRSEETCSMIVDTVMNMNIRFLLILQHNCATQSEGL